MGDSVNASMKLTKALGEAEAVSPFSPHPGLLVVQEHATQKRLDILRSGHVLPVREGVALREIDVRWVQKDPSAPGDWFAMHDDKLNDGRAVNEVDLQELDALGIPRISNLIKFNPGVWWDWDLKTMSRSSAFARFVGEQGVAERSAISGQHHFQPGYMRDVPRTLAPAGSSLSTIRFLATRFLRNGGRSSFAHIIVPDASWVLLNDDSIRYAASRGVGVRVFGVNSQDRLKHFAGLAFRTRDCSPWGGLMSIGTDEPDLAVKELRRREVLWTPEAAERMAPHYERIREEMGVETDARAATRRNGFTPRLRTSAPMTL